MAVRAWRPWLKGVWLLMAACVAQDNIPGADNYLRAANWRAVTLGNTVYIDGGRVSQEGFVPPINGYPMNATLSIDLSISWDPDNVNFKESSGGDKPTRSNQGYFTDPSFESLYVWGGFQHMGFPDTSQQYMWKFEADGQGGGQWDRESPENGDFFRDLVPSRAAASASTPQAGYLFGGIAWNDSTVPIEGFYRYDFGSREWSWERDAGYPTRSIWASTATYVPGYGTGGVIVLLGGKTGVATDDEAYSSFDRAYIYDVEEGQWYTQQTTGDEKPSRRRHHCAVGVGGDDSFEIFIFGGSNDDSKADYGDVFALSLPGFHWTKVGDNADGKRCDHACVAVKSTLLSFGGIQSMTDLSVDGENIVFTNPDPFTRGIGIFDLNELEWRDSYNADAENYTTHSRIRSWYDNGKMETVEWSPGVSALFAAEDEENGDGNNDTGDGEGKSSTPVGAIAGGAVGGVAALAILAGIIWFVLRRRKRARDQSHSQTAATAPYGVESVGKPPGYHSQTATPPFSLNASPYQPTEPERPTVLIELSTEPSGGRPISELPESSNH